MKKNIILHLLLLGTVLTASAQKSNISATVERLPIEYNGKTVKAKKLTVSAEIPMHIDSVWANVKTTDLLIFVTKGYTKFKPVDGAFPKFWPLGDTVSTRTRIFGFLPFGGVRHLYIEAISDADRTIQTREWDRRAKVWDHRITLVESAGNTTLYTDEVIIYGGAMTGFITSFAKQFYKHRQARWRIVARENLNF